MKKAIYLVIGIIALCAVIFFILNRRQEPEVIKTASPQVSALSIVSTNPPDLEGATISPSQAIDITFNKSISKGEFKYKMEPDIEHEVTIVNSESGSFGQTFRITFKKPLELGATFTLIISGETKVNDQERLDHEYIYHVQTIGYKGV